MRWFTTPSDAADPVPALPPPCTPGVDAAADEDRRVEEQGAADRRAEEAWESDGGAIGPSPEPASAPTDQAIARPPSSSGPVRGDEDAVGTA
jgi:hypothetical protein